MIAELTALREALPAIEAELAKRKRRKIDSYYPNDGPLARIHYPKHLEFFRAGRDHRERLVLAANRIGKTEGIGAYETTLHLSGRYPDWWQGRRFSGPITAWAAGDTGKTTRDILQLKLLGPPGDFGSGMIPGELIASTRPKAGLPDAVEIIHVRHARGGYSRLNLKSYDQGRDSFQGTEQQLIWLDEEAPLSIYTECVLRTMETTTFEGGLVMLTFTPINGYTETVKSFLEPEPDTKKFVITATWDDAPHLSEETKKELWNSIPPFQRDARAKGIPALGSGAIYPVPESEITVKPFEIPDNWPRAYGLDVGWNRTAAVWGARNPANGVIYLYDEHYQGREEPSIHAAAIRARGEWIPGAIDPASRGRSQKDGVQLISAYSDLGLNIVPANNAVETGLAEIWQALVGGRLKVFSSLQNWLKEFRLYRRDEQGRIVKQDDHCQDACRYLWLTGRDLMITKPMKQEPSHFQYGYVSAGSWMS